MPRTNEEARIRWMILHYLVTARDTPPGGEWIAFKDLPDGGPGRHTGLRTQRTVNLEDPDEFNAIGGKFLAQADSGRWPNRAPRTVTASITGMR